MMYETENDLAEVESPARGSPVVGALPASVVMSQRCAAMLRAYLREHGLGGYTIYCSNHHDLWDAELHLDALAESAEWEPLAPLIGDGETMESVQLEQTQARAWPSGVLRLANHEVVVARWYWACPENSNCLHTMWLFAAASPQHLFDLKQELERLRHDRGAGVWQIVRGGSHMDGPRMPRVAPDDLFLTDDIRQRVDAELMGFFSDQVAELYRQLKVPYRRGVLLHGPPGNGKTSLIRYIGARLADTPAMILRPAANFDTDDLEEVVRRWSAQAPAMLVIEDLNWLLEHVNVSTFLNLLDGIEGTVTGGLLLIATSNHPDKLDPAINNRPGRFDVVMEVPCPIKRLRADFFARKLPQVDEVMIDRLAAATDGLSFAHLHEVLRLSGLSAIHGGRATRGEKDLLDAADSVRRTNLDAERGFPSKLEVPFGFVPLTSRQR